MEEIQIFLDTDVVISAILSKTGASFELTKNSFLRKTISKTVKQEIEEVVRRLKINISEARRVLRNIKVVSLNIGKIDILKNYKKYVFDEEDAHVVAGAHKLRSRFLLSHNLKHYRVDKIKSDLKIIVEKPGYFLQYLRSLDES